MSENQRTTILFLTADPTDASRLHLGKEIREIRSRLQSARLRNQFLLEERMAVRLSDITQAIFDAEPQIVHFAGHGTKEGELCFEDASGQIHTVKPDALASLFALLSNQIQCVLLNACYSELQANAIAKHINYVIGMKTAIGDEAAITFAVGFYKALGAGRSIEEAYKFGIVELQLHGMPENLTPTLIRNLDTRLTINIENREYGISFDSQGRSTISVASTTFFDYRLRSAFPGIRGIHWFEDPKDALDRLEIFFRKPFSFDESIGNDVMTDPIWWFRGFRDTDIQEFLRVKENKCILDSEELLIKKIAVFHADSYWQSFIYIETWGEKSIGIDPPYSQEQVNNLIKKFGFVSEEYGIFGDVPISRHCYDDGAAVIDGEVTATYDAKLRVRYLTDYNIVIAPKFSPINSQDFVSKSQPLLDGILRGTHSFESLLTYIKLLHRHKKDS